MDCAVTCAVAGCSVRAASVEARSQCTTPIDFLTRAQPAHQHLLCVLPPTSDKLSALETVLEAAVMQCPAVL